MSFCTVINCMDGRTQLPVIHYLRDRFDVDFVDSVTEAGPVRYLADERRSATTESMLRRVNVSVEKHGSRGVALVVHHDCAGNPLDKDEQLGQLERALAFLRAEYPGAEVIGLWVDDRWTVEEV